MDTSNPPASTEGASQAQGAPLEKRAGQGPAAGVDERKAARGNASGDGSSPRDPNQPADIAPKGPSTAYEYPRGDRGAAATEHERQVRESLSGPSRDDAARGP